jgi:hypothetical protein
MPFRRTTGNAAWPPSATEQAAERPSPSNERERPRADFQKKSRYIYLTWGKVAAIHETRARKNGLPAAGGRRWPDYCPSLGTLLYRVTKTCAPNYLSFFSFRI